MNTDHSQYRFGESCDCDDGPTWVPSRMEEYDTTHFVTHVCCIRCETELKIGNTDD